MEGSRVASRPFHLPLLALSSLVSLQCLISVSLFPGTSLAAAPPLDSISPSVSSPFASPFFSPLLAPVSPRSPVAGAPLFDVSPQSPSDPVSPAVRPETSQWPLAPGAPASGPRPSFLSAVSRAEPGRFAKAAPRLSLLQVPLEVTVLEHRANGEIVEHPGLGTRPATPARGESEGKEILEELDAAGASTSAVISPGLKRALSEEGDDEAGSSASSPGKTRSAQSRGFLGGARHWLKKKIIGFFMRIFNPTSLKKKGNEAAAIDKYLEDPKKLDAELKCVRIRDEKARTKKFSAFCKKFKGWPKLMELCTLFSGRINHKLADNLQCNGLSFRECLEAIEIPLVQPFFTHMNELTVHHMSGDAANSEGSSPRRRRGAFDPIQRIPVGPASVRLGEFVVGVSESASAYAKHLASDEDGGPGSYLAPSCVYREEVSRNEKTKTRKLQRAGNKGQRDRVQHLHSLYKLVHLAEFGTPAAFDGMFIALLTQVWTTKTCPNEVRKLRRKKHLLKTSDGTVRVSGGDIFTRALILSVARAALPSARDCLASHPPSGNCLAMIFSVNMEQPWKQLMHLVAGKDTAAAIKLIGELPHILQTTIPTAEALDKARGRLTEQLQQIFSLVSGSGRAGRKVLNVIAKWKWLLKMITRLVSFLSSMHRGSSGASSVAARVGQRLAAKGQNTRTGHLVTDAMLLEMASRSGANMKCVTALAGYGQFVEKCFRAVANAEIKKSRRAVGSSGKGRRSASAAFVSLREESGEDTRRTDLRTQDFSTGRSASRKRRDQAGNDAAQAAEMQVISLPDGEARALSFLGDENESDDSGNVNEKQKSKTSRHKKLFYVILAISIFLFIQAVITTPTGVAIFVGVLLSIVCVIMYFLPEIIAMVRNRSVGGGGSEEEPLFSGDDGDGKGGNEDGDNDGDDDAL
uniref:Transmembrane protein n=1 Tax=Neospora caninum (strain Liverpool) TaxID=572307 RepID=A0A0F7UG95_NEOCL|nr:TPA: hypothetical protein BN1204_047600 [Neospora caninum Liverpool]